MSSAGLTVACGTSTPEAPPAKPDAAAKATLDPGRVLLMVQAQFGADSKPGPAKAVLYRPKGAVWSPEIIEDPDSNVWHKGIFWRDGILTIGAQRALLKHWTRGDGGWTSKTLWEGTFGGTFDRLRDLEIGDVDGDGKDELVIATHDQGIIAVGDEAEDGTWTVQEFDKKADTFVHEVEIGDLDGDGKLEFYVTPSERNQASGASQPGGVFRYDVQPDGTYARRPVVEYADTHAKEILVTDLDGDGTDELYVAKEGVTRRESTGLKLNAPVTIERYTPDGDGFVKTDVARLTGEPQCRFLVAGDVDGDGKSELVAAAKNTGLWLVEADGQTTQIAEKSGGFEHATHLADFDGDGTPEIYAASELSTHRLLRRYTWNGERFAAEVIAPIPHAHITWNLADGVLPPK